ncbi:DNA internalization-related competence protein ComEC/Rec2 [Vibrio sonorensis]|uniref:DNA internalization-related competence protein ComEC/Rec2 n=1 Tax=Vibrio sonorensis TaxID=1004316 RepID=UPI000A06EAB0|nr:DNA internalization-related competence protein ComEC/Rec2 [Vibrio sonorensis]
MTLCFNYWTLTSFCVVILSAMKWPTLPSLNWVLLFLLIIMTTIRVPPVKWGAGIILGLMVIIIQGNLFRVKSHSVFKAGQDITINAEVNSFFKQISHGFEGVVLIRSINGHKLPWYQQSKVKLIAPHRLYAGDKVRAKVRLARLIGRFNGVGFDKEAYWFSQGVVGEAKISDKTSYIIFESLGFRSKLYQTMSRVVEDNKLTPLLISLVFGDRNVINNELEEGLRKVGLSHLFVISGLHIGMAFFIGCSLGIWLMGITGRFLYLPLLLGLFFALSYAFLAGFTVSTLRALLMCGLMACFILLEAKVSLLFKWLLTLSLVLLLDPFSPLSAGFWLSFAAVALIFYLVELLFSHPAPFRKLIPLAMVPVLIMPFSLVWFGGISVTGIAYNLVWIPWFSILVVPVLLLSVGVWTVFPNLSELMWQWLDMALKPVVYSLEVVEFGWLAISHSWVAFFLSGLMVFVLWPYLNFTSRAAALLLSLLTLSSIRAPNWQVEVLDVGHGLAVIIRKDGHAVLYDTAAAWTDGSVAKSIITPYLKQVGVHTLDGVIISHFDSDHAGGLSTITNQWNPNWLRTSQLGVGLPCVKGQEWRWQEVSFDVLWPPKRVARAYNPHSCVIRVRFGTPSPTLLLSGDITTLVEYLLLREGVVRSDIVVIPHHGSKTSSSIAFVEGVQAKFALSSNRFRGRWNLPAQEVVERYKNSGALWLDTGKNGLIRVDIFANDYTFMGLEISKVILGIGRC